MALWEIPLHAAMLTIDPKDIQAKYVTKKDSKKRVVADSAFEHFEVTVLKNGTLVFRPRILVDPESFSEDIVSQIRESLALLSKGKVGKVIDIQAGEQALQGYKSRKLDRDKKKKALR